MEVYLETKHPDTKVGFGDLDAMQPNWTIIYNRMIRMLGRIKRVIEKISESEKKKEKESNIFFKN